MLSGNTSATVTEQGTHKLPVGQGSAELVSVKYPAEGGGYTPGDTWNLYVGKDNRVEYLDFHHGGNVRAGGRHRNVDRLQESRSPPLEGFGSHFPGSIKADVVLLGVERMGKASPLSKL